MGEPATISASARRHSAERRPEGPGWAWQSAQGLLTSIGGRAEGDKVRALDVGAGDYVTRPCGADVPPEPWVGYRFADD